MANAEYISYASPNALVYESETYQADMGQEAMEILYPDLGDFAQQYNTCLLYTSGHLRDLHGGPL